MKNPIIIVASAIGMSLSTSASAQSSVTLYGMLDVSAEHLSFDRTATRPAGSLTALTSDASRFGFRGTEDLGGGLRAYFKMESGLQADTGTQSSAAAFFNRESYVGLSSPQWGSVQLGSQWTPAIAMTVKVDPFTRFGVGGQYTLLQGVRGYQIRYDNVVQYVSPTIAGLTGRLLASSGEGAATGNSFTASIDFSKGPVYLGGIYDRVNATAASVGLTGSPVPSKTLSVAAAYDFEIFRLSGWYQKNQIATLADVNGYMLGVTVPVGVGEVRASYAHRSATNASASLWAIGYGHHLSKRTQLYVNVGRLLNSGTATFRMGPATAEQAAAGRPFAGQDTNGTQVGIRHWF